MTRPRKSSGGEVLAKQAKRGRIEAQTDRERQRHTNANAGLLAKRLAAMAFSDPARRQLALAGLASKQQEENQRYRAKLADLTRRARDAVR